MQEPLVDPAEAAGLAVLEECAVLEAQLFARRARQLHDSFALSVRLQGADGPERFLVLDVAGTLRIGQGQATSALDEANRLVQDLPGLLGGLAGGQVLLPQARVVLEETRHTTSAVRLEVDRRLAGPFTDCPAGWTARRLRTLLTRLVLRVEGELAPGQTEQRQDRATRRRAVSVRPEPDGMASLWALLPAPRMAQFTAGLDELTRRQALRDREQGVTRTQDQRRADVLASLPGLALHALDGTALDGTALDGTGLDGTGCAAATLGGCAGARVVLDVHVPMATVLGFSQEPGHLAGYGPVSAHQVRTLLPQAWLRQVLVDDRTGEVLHSDSRLVPPAAPGAGRSGAAARPAARSRPQPVVVWLGDGPVRGSHPDIHPDTRPDVHPDIHSDTRRSAQPPGRQHTAAGPTGHSTDPPPPAGAPSPEDADRLARLLPLDVLVLPDAPEPRHDPSAALTRLLQSRDPLCTGPGCSASSRRSDLDHAVPWPLGPTTAANMRPHSRRCHRAKTFTWRADRDLDGTLVWTSPTGRSYPVPALWQTPPTPRRGRPAQPCPEGVSEEETGALAYDQLTLTAALALEADTVRTRSPRPAAAATRTRTVLDWTAPAHTGPVLDPPF